MDLPKRARIKLMKSFQELEVWQRGMELAKALYPATERFPKGEMFGLTSQIRRASVSIPCNIAEGYARNSRKEYLQFLGIASGSQAELTTLLILAKQLGLLPEADRLIEEAAIVGRMLTRLRQSLSPKP